MIVLCMVTADSIRDLLAIYEVRTTNVAAAYDDLA